MHTPRLQNSGIARVQSANAASSHCGKGASELASTLQRSFTMNWILAASVFSAVGVSLAACGSMDPVEDDERGYDESAIMSTYKLGNEDFFYLDTHDAYAHTGVVDKRKFVYFHRKEGKKAIALTFDCAWVDNPNGFEILDVLKRNNIKTTFFIAGQFLFKNSARGAAGGYIESAFPLIKRMIDDGHEFGNHSKTHPHNNQSVRWDLELSSLEQAWEEVVKRIYGANVPANAHMKRYWRAPYGEYDAHALALASSAQFPYHFGWNVDTKDSTGKPLCRSESEQGCLSPSRLTNAVLKFGDNNGFDLDAFVVLAHLQNPYRWGKTPDGLQRLIDTLRSKDIVFAKVSEIFDETPLGPEVPASTVRPGTRCAAGCVWSSSCVSTVRANASLRATAQSKGALGRTAEGADVVCTTSGTCEIPCTPR
jgi:peptidoglycan/xylan/chitin deacetylase (PgdA/CDA1 family)